MTRYERIKTMSIEQIAAEIVRTNFTDEYCKSYCADCCQWYELDCCVRWLLEVAAND